jgi:syntaxin-binding protein 5
MAQNPVAGIIGGFIKGMKDKAEENAKMRESLTLQTPSEHLESIFLKEPFDEPSIPNLDDPIEELSIGSLSPSLYILKHTFILSDPSLLTWEY